MNRLTRKASTESQYFRKLVKIFHHGRLRCPKCHEHDGLHVHEDHREPWHILRRCIHCNKIFTVWTGTPFRYSHRLPSEIWRIMQSIFTTESDSDLARKLDCDRGKLAAFRNKLQRWMNRLPKEDFMKMATSLKKRF